MRISVSTRHGQLAPETQEKINNKVEKLGRFHDKISSAKVTIDLKQDKQPSVELTVAVDGAANFVSQTRGTNLLGAVEGAVQKLEEQLKRHKKKLIDHHRDSARRRPLADAPAGQESDDEFTDDEIADD